MNPTSASPLSPALLAAKSQAAESACLVRPTVQAVFVEHAAFVLRTVRSLGVRSADVEDVAQEVFVIVHRKLDTWNGTCSLRTWLFGIAMRVASGHRRKAYVRREQIDQEGAMQCGAVPPEQAEALRRKQLRAQLDRALDTLDDQKRAVFVLYELEGVPIAEIAESQGCALFTAYGRLRAARAQVRASFEALQATALVQAKVRR